jgi:hypothetical protein
MNLVPVVTPDDVAVYYASIGITDYPRNASGPIMKQNNTAIKIIYTEKYKHMVEKIRQEKMREGRIDSSKQEDCPICFEPMAGRSILDCSHIFCIQCSIQHFRVKQTCPLCRAEVCTPAKKEVLPLPDETITQIVDDNLEYIHPDRINYNLYNFIKQMIDSKSDTVVITNEIFHEVRKLGFDIANDIKSWYE